MGLNVSGRTIKFIQILGAYMRNFLFRILSVGPIPNHIAFIMDGNRRYAKKKNLDEGAGYKAGFLSLMSTLKYCNELGVKYVTVYAFSVDNFKRRPEEVKCVMDIMQEKIEGLLKLDSIVNQYGVRVYFIGNLKMLNESVRISAEKAMEATAKNTNSVLLICMAYSSSDEIVQSVQKSCRDKWDGIKTSNCLKEDKFDEIEVLDDEKSEKLSTTLLDIEKHMYMAVAPDPDILIRTSGGTRLSNFQIWQTTKAFLFFASALWPEFGLWHLVLAVLSYQRNYSYFEKKKKQA